jgi:hypothetical protein
MKNPLHRLSLRTLKFFLRFMRRTHELFTGTGVAIVSAALVVGIFMLVWWGIGVVKSAIELRLERALVEQLLSLVSPDRTDQSDQTDTSNRTNILETPALKQFIQPSNIPGLVSASFSDLFSGVGWLDEGATTMYHDRNATAFLFEPRFSVMKETPPSFVTAPDRRWSGTVEKRGDVYEGYVNGELFVTSPYQGTFGFGGDDENWLAVYGAYEGAAFQFRDGSPARDVSRLFGIRMMSGGFAPVVVRNAGMAAWYVFPRGEGHVRFLKLFEDSDGWISGATDLTDAVVRSVGVNATLLAVKAGVDGTVWMQFETGGGGGWYRFTDEGFAWGKGMVVSGDLNEGREAEVRRARISRVDLAAAGSDIRFFLANQEGEWVPAEVGEWLTFPDPEGKNLFWRAEFDGATGVRKESPFFDFIQVEYFLKF